MNFQTLHLIQFPVYVLHNDEVEKRDGLLFCDTQIVDDRNVQGETLGIRRLKTPHKNLYPLKYMLEDFRSMIQHRGNNYIDSSGRYFQYEKTTTIMLDSIQIEKIEQKGTASLIWLRKVPFPFTVKRPPEKEMKYAQVLMVNKKPSVLWSYAEKKQKRTWRKV
jgi:hypothetical protein